MRSPKNIKSGDVRYHGSAGEGGGGLKGRLKKKFGFLIFFTAFEYKADIANTCISSRLVRVGDLSQ